MRIAWFSPFPPVRTGIAACSADVIAALARRGYAIDPYPVERAHDFPWRHRRQPYDLVVYQFGNSSHHDYEWAYALRYPGLVVLHDTHLHHARAAFLLRERRADDYRAEFRWSHPEVNPDAAELAVAGFDSELYYEWGMVRSLVRTARLVAVHGALTRDRVIGRSGDRAIDDQRNREIGESESRGIEEKIVSIRLGHGELVTPQRRERGRREVRAKYGIAQDAVLFGCFGGITPEKRVPQILAALSAITAYAPGARLLLAGTDAAHYDVRADIASRGLEDRVTMTGYLDDDRDLTDHLAACDVSLNLRWPTAGETSGPWLRALAAGVATVITDLVHLGDVPSLDPRTWTLNAVAVAVGESSSEVRGQRSVSGLAKRPLLSEAPSSAPATLQPQDGLRTSDFGPRTATPPAPVTVAIDILDEDHSLRLAMRRLATDGSLREQLGRAGQAYWQREHSIEVMVDDYVRIIEEAVSRPAGTPMDAPDVPAHLHDSGDRRLRALLEPFGIGDPF